MALEELGTAIGWTHHIGIDESGAVIKADVLARYIREDLTSFHTKLHHAIASGCDWN